MGRGRWSRLPALAFVGALLAPGVWVRDPPPRVVDAQELTATPLNTEGMSFGSSGLEISGLWHLESPNSRFGGYSALVALPGGRLMAFSDAGHALTFGDPEAPVAGVSFHPLSGNYQAKSSVDIEAATRDPETGTVWIASENTNSIRRTNDRLEPGPSVRPEAMRGWPSNGGPEAIARLADGRMLVLSESVDGFGASAGPGLLFPGDPLDGGEPVSFRFAPPEGFRATDAAALPDGRVLILLRRLNLTLPLSFDARLIVADPAQIRPGKPWPWKSVAQLAPPLPRDNFEGLAVVPQRDGSATLWLISDDNGAVFQRTLLVKLRWRIPPP